MKKRRQFFKTALGAGVATLIPSTIFAHPNEEISALTTIKPRALKKGDTIGLIAPGYAIKPEVLVEAKETLEKWDLYPTIRIAYTVTMAILAIRIRKGLLI